MVFNQITQTISAALANIRGTGHRKIPARISDAIAHNDNLSEVVVRLLQLMVFGAWGVLYAASPQPDPSTSSLFPTVISAYLILTIIGLIWACYRHIPNWAIYCSILFDISLLIFLIWSFHIQYQQPPSFSLKAPAMLNLFLLIALRALRFESRFVIAAGTAAILGWSALVGYVVFSDPADPMVTRDYVTYLTSNSVLIGSEIAKLISLLFFTLILAIAVRQGHNLLVNSISEQAAAQSLSRFFDESVADTIKSSDQQIEAGRGISRDAAILMVDIRGFTRLASQIPSDQAMALLSEYQSKLVPIIQRHGGTIDKFMGDGIMATFGVVHPSATYCADALKAVQALLDEASSWQTDPLLGTLQPRAVNAAVASGPVIFGAVGNSERLEYTVIGTPVNLAAKIEKLNKDHGTLAIATHTAFSTALDQGFRALANPEPLNFEVGKEADAVPCVVLAR